MIRIKLPLDLQCAPQLRIRPALSYPTSSLSRYHSNGTQVAPSNAGWKTLPRTPVTNRIVNIPFSSPPSRRGFSSTTNKNDPLETSPARIEPMERFRLYRYLQLKNFTKDEVEGVFDRIERIKLQDDNMAADTEGNDVLGINEKNLTKFLLQRIMEIENEDRKPEEVQPTTPVGGEGGIRANDDYASERQKYAQHEARRILQVFDTSKASNSIIAKDQFVQLLLDQATAVDYKTMAPITFSILLVGTSVGIVTPAMPFVVSALELTPGQYGTVVSAFALAKMTGNIPSAILVERHGRKPFLTWSLVIIALGIGGIGAASSFEQLYVCRFLTGAGVAALTTATQLMVTDVSTPLNRATTMSPIVSAFAAGAALGPAIGGGMVDSLGLQSTFFLVGSSYLGVGLLNSFTLQETQRKGFFLPKWDQLITDKFSNDKVNYESGNDEKGASNITNDKDQVSLSTATKTALAQWVPLFQNPKIRSIMIMNIFYWFALAGSQMTLLPLLLTNPSSGLNLTASGVGQVYMTMSIVQVMSNPIMARYLVDRIGKKPAIAGGCGVIASSMALLPLFADNWPLFMSTLGFWALGSSMLSTAPLAYISDSVGEEERAQAIAMLRTSGDIGFLFGASCVGALVDVSGSIEVAMQASGGLLSAATLWFIARQSMLHTQRLPKK